MHVRCPHCHNPIDVVDDSDFAEITCPSCGSGFSLVDVESTVTMPPFGARDFRHFEFVRELGYGGFGTVWLAKDKQLDRNVAIKVPRNGVVRGREAELFLRDARAAAQLRHSNIVTIHEIGKEDDTLFIVSDFIEGASLKSWLTGRRLSFRESAALIIKVAEAVHHAHQQGVIHRDLKPSNIMIDGNGEPHVIDFGMAKREAGEITMTQDGQILGTPAYMPPEQASGKGHDADARSDVYSLGVILFELLTDELPFRGDKDMLLVQILRHDPPRLRNLVAKLPRDLETITLKCLEKDPAKRYATAQALADDLAAWADGRPIKARPVGRMERGWRWAKRHPGIAGLTAALAASLVLGTVVSVGFAVEAGKSAVEAQANAESEQKQRREAERLADAEAEARKDAEKQKDRAEGLLYVSNIQRAQTMWDDDKAGPAWDALNDCPKERRGWEHDYLTASGSPREVATKRSSCGMRPAARKPSP
jgi:hypothetical protein